MADSKALGRKMIRSVMVALTLLGGMVTASYFINDRMAQIQAYDATVINIAGRQRMLSQRIMMLGAKVAAIPAEERVRWSMLRADLMAARDLFVASHDNLYYGSAQFGLKPVRDPAVLRIHNEAPHRLEERFADYVRIADEILAAPPGGITTAQLDALYEHARQPLLAALHAKVGALESASITRSEVLRHVLSALAVGVLLGLLAVGLFVFRPMIRQVTKAVAAQEELGRELQHRALHDPLTGLPNRRYADEEIRRALANGERSGDKVAVLHVDLDKFKQVNDTLGHAAGDTVLAQATRVMTQCIRRGDFVARVGGDEFVILVPQARDLGGLISLSERLVEEISRPIDCDGAMAHIGASIGIAISPPSKADLDALLHDADVALYEAKAAGRGCWRMHAESRAVLDAETLARVVKAA
ncbi:MAG: diguanylate cyclase [Pseudomonadota bacterium]